MDKLLAFLNRLDGPARTVFCSRIGTSEGYLRKAISVGQMLRVELCVSIERESGCEITRRDLRPTDYGRLWPELEQAEASS